MLRIKHSIRDRGCCLSCGDRNSETEEIRIDRKDTNANENICCFCLCKKCLNQLAMEFSNFIDKEQ